jgi:hypothetical protein
MRYAKGGIANGTFATPEEFLGEGRDGSSPRLPLSGCKLALDV